jgi:hypothetical protein
MLFVFSLLNDRCVCIISACEEGWALFAGHCYYFSETKASWDDAVVIMQRNFAEACVLSIFPIFFFGCNRHLIFLHNLLEQYLCNSLVIGFLVLLYTYPVTNYSHYQDYSYKILFYQIFLSVQFLSFIFSFRVFARLLVHIW